MNSHQLRDPSSTSSPNPNCPTAMKSFNEPVLANLARSSRSDETTVAVGLQPTYRHLLNVVVSRQRRLNCRLASLDPVCVPMRKVQAQTRRAGASRRIPWAEDPRLPSAHRFAMVSCSLALLFCAVARSQNYSIDWFKIAGGGGVSTGAVFSVSGTIGQHDAGPTMTNGQFSLTGGFWVLPQAVQVEGAPALSIAPAAPGYCTISWAPATLGFVLQENCSLTPANWTNSPSGSTNPVTLPANAPAKFFRLRKL
jgi:hypothetical protein